MIYDLSLSSTFLYNIIITINNMVQQDIVTWISQLENGMPGDRVLAILQEQKGIDWSEYFLPPCHPILSAPRSPPRHDEEIWPQWVHGHMCDNRTQRDHAEREHRQADGRSETPEYGEVKDPQKMLASPPGTPDHIKFRCNTLVEPSASPTSRARHPKGIKKRAPRRPITRSIGPVSLALHQHKGYVVVQSQLMTFSKYLRRHVGHSVP